MPTFEIIKPLRTEAIEEPFERGLKAWLSRLWNGSDRKYRLTDDFVFELNGIRYRVRKGYITDGTSLPRALWFLFGTPWTGPQRWAAVPHDAGYSGELEYCFDLDRDLWMKVPFGRFGIDRMFREVLRAKHASWIKSRGMYRGVRLFGWRRYRNGLLEVQ